MKKTSKFLSLFLVLLLIITCTGCGKSKDPMVGTWCYIHDTETPILVTKSNGKATFKNVSYKYKTDSDFITLTAADGTSTQMRYKADGEDEMLLYENTVYTYQDEGTPDGLVGNWYCEATKWSFEFTTEGTFMEDGYFPGMYTVNPDGNSFSLIYNDMFEDTLCYYSIDGNQLTISYPWLMVRTK